MPLNRHPGEGRDPLVDDSGADGWIPASAGTTDVESERLSTSCGVKLAGIDLSLPLLPADKAAINVAFLAHHVVVFPGQRLTREAQFAFAAQFGEVAAHGAHRPGAENKRYRVAHVMSNLGPDGRPAARRSPAANYHWHTDKPYLAAPPLLTILYAVELPPAGGDTEFADMSQAYDALTEAMKRRIAGLRVAFRPAFDDGRPGADHPLVRTHPDTGKKSLYLGNHSTGIVGLPEEEGRALLAELLAHATQPRFVYTHRWRLRDLVMWDNRCLLHRAVLNYDIGRDRRVMHRSVVKGPVPV